MTTTGVTVIVADGPRLFFAGATAANWRNFASIHPQMGEFLSRPGTRVEFGTADGDEWSVAEVIQAGAESPHPEGN